MGKTCAFFGNDYDFMHNRKRERRPKPELKELIKKQAIRLIEKENVTDFLVGQIGGFEQDAYDTVLNIKKEYPHIRVILVICSPTELNLIDKDDSGYILHRRYFDDFICPDKCAVGYKRFCIIYRNRYIAQHTDFIIAYNCYKGRVYQICQTAANKGVTVINLAEMKLNSI
ncbi:MAG: hypothetical protein IJS88_07015 [Alphaproteobacteria bacterium]|nr:hypothetical protein [Alphaproteobacteria bacterium]